MGVYDGGRIRHRYPYRHDFWDSAREEDDLKKIIRKSIDLLGDNHWSYVIVRGLYNDLNYRSELSWSSGELKLFRMLLQARYNERKSKLSGRERTIDRQIRLLIQTINEVLASRGGK